MSKDEQNRLAAACAEVAELTGQALTWVSAPGNADLVGVEARSLTRQMRRSIRRARRLGHAAQTRMSVSVFGPSQAGKSFLVSVLARPEGGRLVGAFDGPGGALDYIAEVNPEGEGESTGLVTRFTMARDPAPEGFPVRLTLLSEADLIRVLINSFFNDGDNSEIPPEPEALSAHLDAFRARMGGVQPGLSEDEVWEVGEYIAGSFGKSAYAAALRPFLEEAAEIAPTLALPDRAAFFAPLWGDHAELGALYERLSAALARLGHAGHVHARLDALIPRETSVIDVKTLSGLFGAETAAPLHLCLPSGQTTDLPRAEACALAAELVFPMAEAPSALFTETDLLDFPGARNRFEEPLAKTLSDLERNIPQLLLRGKVAYLFDRYVENQDITSMLLCVPGSNMETLDLPGLVDNWIAQTHGATPAERAANDCVLFFVLTKFDEQLGESASDKGVTTRFERRMQASLLERFGRGRMDWVSEWAPGRPFDNCYWLRNPNYFVDGLIDYDDARREVQVRPDKAARIAELKSGCLAALPVQRHFAEPEAAWDAALALNDGGVSYLTARLGQVCKPDAKLRQIAVQLDRIAADLDQAMRPYHVSDDVETRIEEARHRAAAVIDDLEAALARHRFGAFLSGLNVDQDAVEAAIARVPSSVRITSAVSAATAAAAPVAAAASASPARPSRPGRPARPAAPVTPEPAADTPPIRTRTLEQFQSETALELWVDRLKALRDDPAARAALALGEGPAADLVAELIHAIRRTGLPARIAGELAQVNFGLNVEKQAAPAAILAAERINRFVATLGMEDLPPEARPMVDDGAGGERRAFAPRATSDTVDSLPPAPRNVAEALWSDWVYALDAVFEANARDGVGGEIDIDANLALGRILAALAERRAAS